MVPAMRQSDVVMPLWTGGFDVKLAVEVGAALLLDKPLVLIVQVGTPVPDKLVGVADRILEVDTRRPPGEWSADLRRRITKVVDEMGADRG